MSEHTSVEKLGDDLCGGLKVSSNVEIARSLRNNFRVNVGVVGRGGRATESEWGPTRLPIRTKLRIPLYQAPAARRRGISSVVERGTTQTACYGPSIALSAKGSWTPKTARMLA